MVDYNKILRQWFGGDTDDNRSIFYNNVPNVPQTMQSPYPTDPRYLEERKKAEAANTPSPYPTDPRYLEERKKSQQPKGDVGSVYPGTPVGSTYDPAELAKYFGQPEVQSHQVTNVQSIYPGTPVGTFYDPVELGEYWDQFVDTSKNPPGFPQLNFPKQLSQPNMPTGAPRFGVTADMLPTYVPPGVSAPPMLDLSGLPVGPTSPDIGGLEQQLMDILNKEHGTPDRWVSPFTPEQLAEIGDKLSAAGINLSQDYRDAIPEINAIYNQARGRRNERTDAFVDELAANAANIGVDYRQGAEAKQLASDAGFLDEVSNQNQATDTSYMEKLAGLTGSTMDHLGFLAREGLLTPKQFVKGDTNMSQADQMKANYITGLIDNEIKEARANKDFGREAALLGIKSNYNAGLAAWEMQNKNASDAARQNFGLQSDIFNYGLKSDHAASLAEWEAQQAAANSAADREFDMWKYFNDQDFELEKMFTKAEIDAALQQPEIPENAALIQELQQIPEVQKLLTSDYLDLAEGDIQKALILALQDRDNLSLIPGTAFTADEMSTLFPDSEPDFRGLGLPNSPGFLQLMIDKINQGQTGTDATVVRDVIDFLRRYSPTYNTVM